MITRGVLRYFQRLSPQLTVVEEFYLTPEYCNKKGPSYGAFSIYLGKSSSHTVTAGSAAVPSYASGPRPQEPKLVPRALI